MLRNMDIHELTFPAVVDYLKNEGLYVADEEHANQDPELLGMGSKQLNKLNKAKEEEEDHQLVANSNIPDKWKKKQKNSNNNNNNNNNKKKQSKKNPPKE